MKRFFIFFALIVVLETSAQAQGILTKEANAPRHDDSLIRQEMEYASAGDDGQDVIWDFSDIPVISSRHSTMFVCDSDSVIITGISPDDMRHYAVRNDTLMYLRYETPLQYIDYTSPIVQLTFPFGYGNIQEGTFAGNGKYCQEKFLFTEGSSIVEADGYGSLCLTKGDTIENVLRLHSVRTSSIRMSPSADSSEVDSIIPKQEIEERYQWYARGYRYPVYETVSTTYFDDMIQVSCLQRAYRCLPEVQALMSDSINRRILLEDSLSHDAQRDIIHYEAECANGRLTVCYSLDEDACICWLICNKMGMLFRSVSQTVESGTGYQMEFDCNGLTPDDYILYINVNGKVYSEKFRI